MQQWTYKSNSKIVHKGNCPVCPSSDAYHEYEDGHCHCYSCGEHTMCSRSSAILEALKSETKVHDQSTVSLPKDFDYFLPDRASHWLNRWNLTITEKRKAKIGFSEKLDSLIFPVFGPSDQFGDPVYYQSRYFGVDSKVPKWRTVGSKEDTLYLPESHKDDTIVMVEDIISAIKVSRVTNCTPLCGSTASMALKLRLQRHYRRARVWLDADARLKGLETTLALNELGLRTTMIWTDHDPKYYGTADLRFFTNVTTKVDL